MLVSFIGALAFDMVRPELAQYFWHAGFIMPWVGRRITRWFWRTESDCSDDRAKPLRQAWRKSFKPKAPFALNGDSVKAALSVAGAIVKKADGAAERSEIQSWGSIVIRRYSLRDAYPSSRFYGDYRALALALARRVETRLMRGTIAEDPRIMRDVTGDSFKSMVLEGSGPIVVEFMSYGCGHCRMLEPVLQDVAKRLEMQETFYRVNVAVEHELANSYEITGTPTLVLFRNAKEVCRVVGPSPKAAIVLQAVSQPFNT